jgi:hypothetical protein
MVWNAAAYKHGDGKKIDGKRVLVDVERARTVKGWLPRRLGGGLGGTRRGGPDVNIKHSGREDNERERERYRLEREREDRSTRESKYCYLIVPIHDAFLRTSFLKKKCNKKIWMECFAIRLALFFK